jgi:hypothetical protein
MVRILATFLCILMLTAVAVRGQEIFTTDVQTVTVSPNREDVKAIGMGRTQTANGHTFNAMLYNPALLSHTRTSYDVIAVEASASGSTLDALAFYRDNKGQFQTGEFLKNIRAGALGLQNGTMDQASAVRLINSGLNFTRQFQEKVLGSAENPKIHAVTAIPSVQVQVDNWGFALSGNLIAGFQSSPTDALIRLYTLQLPEDLNMLTNANIQDLLAIVGQLIDPVTGELSFKEAIPTTFAVATFDIVGAVGYGREIQKNLSVGANLKIVNRRFSTKIIQSNNYDSFLTDVRSDFQTSVTGVTLDLGGLYRIPRSKFDVGLSLQNIIPVKKATTQTDLAAVVYDQAGNAVPIKVKIPFELKIPFLANAGVNYAAMPNWDASFDWVDIADQDKSFSNYVEHFRLGTEYRLDAVPGSLGIAFRGGLATKHFGGGVGLNIYRVVQIDFAYAYSLIIDAYAYFGQVKIGW